MHGLLRRIAAKKNHSTLLNGLVELRVVRYRGIGIIHNNMEIAQQVQQVRKTKRFENGFITEPFVLKPTDTVHDVDCIKKVGSESLARVQQAKGRGSMFPLLSFQANPIDFWRLCSSHCRAVGFLHCGTVW